MELDAALIADQRKHGVHTLIVYGSRALGTATAESDLDVAGFADVTEILRDARLWNGIYLDAFVYPTNVLTQAPDPDLLKLRGGRVILDERQLAGGLLAALDALDRRGPPPLSEPEARMRRVWARKMLARIGRGDVEAHYRHHWLLYQLLEDYYAVRGEWYRGPKRAFVDLAERAPETFAVFARALAPGAALETLEALIDHLEAPPTNAADLLAGTSLADMVGTRGPIPWREAFEILRSLCAAVVEARIVGVMYPDLMPETVYVHQQPAAPPTVKLVDVGIHVMRGTDAPDTHRPPHPARPRQTDISWMHYASPERLNEKALDARSDVYLLGILIYELVTGRQPFPGAKGPASIIIAQRTQTPMPPSVIRPDVPPTVDRVLATCLAKEPAARFADVTDLAVAVAAALGSA